LHNRPELRILTIEATLPWSPANVVSTEEIDKRETELDGVRYEFDELKRRTAVIKSSLQSVVDSLGNNFPLFLALPVYVAPCLLLIYELFAWYAPLLYISLGQR
jgi:hypothetical protein